MKQRTNALLANEFVCEPVHAITIDLLHTIFGDVYRNTDNELSHLKKYEYVYTQLMYGDWRTSPDVLKYVKQKARVRIRKKRCFFIFDASNEGFSPTGSYAIFDYLYSSCDFHSIDPGMIIYLSGNLEDEKNITEYTQKHNRKPFHVVSLVLFEQAVARTKDAQDTTTHKPYSAAELYKLSKTRCQKTFRDKLFSSLSRVNRPYRALATFMLCQRKISNQALISHDALDNDTYSIVKEWALTSEYSPFAVSTWAASLPVTVDQEDFKINWATEVPYRKIHDSTLFQIVNETHVDNFNETSLFYSEKSFKPMLMCQPFLIYGQRGANHALKDLGYKTYEDWFDLSFDYEEDNILRYKMMLKSVESACNHLNSLSRDEKIAWRFKNKGLLVHNCTVMQNSAYSKNKLYQFFKTLSIT
jgi:hypothetical protein